MKNTIGKRLLSLSTAFTLLFSLFVFIPDNNKYIISVNASNIIDGKKVVQVELGSEYSACITEDGCLYTWGWNLYGEIGDGSSETRSKPVKIMDNVKQVSLASSHSACITEDGCLYTWGGNYYGQLGDCTSESKKNPVKIMDNVKQVSLGYSRSACITEDGCLYTWGNNSYGLLGDGTTIDKNKPVKIMDNVKQVCLGGSHAACITEDGCLYMWGYNTNVQLDNGLAENLLKTPHKIMDNVKQVSLGYSHSACITEDGCLYTWGDNSSYHGGGRSYSYGRLGDGSSESRNKPVKIMDNVKQVSLGDYHSACISYDSCLYTWGDNYYGQLGDGTEDSKLVPTKIVIPKDETSTVIIPGKNPNHSESYNTGSFGSDDYIIQEVKKYCTDGKDEFVERTNQILSEDTAWAVKQNELLKVYNKYGINDIREGFKTVQERNEYLSQTLPYRYNYNLLVTNEFYCANQYDYEIKNNIAKQAALSLQNLIFNDSDLTSQISDAIFRPDNLSNFPEAKKNKEMLREFLETVQENKANDMIYNSLDFAETALEVFNTDEVYEAQFNHIMEKLSACKDKKEAEKLMQEGANYLLENTKLKDGSVALNTKSIAKAFNISSAVIKFGTATTNDVLAFIYLEQELANYQNNMEFLKTIVENENATIYMRLAANSLLNDIDNKYKELVLHFCGNVFDLTLGVCDYELWTELLGESVGDFFATYRLAVVLSNMVIDTGDFCKQTAYAQGYAQLSELYADILKKDRENFLTNETANNAWKFFSDYSVLWNLRQCGEYQYEKAQHIKTFMGLFDTVPYNYPFKISVVNETLKTLENAKFTIDKSESIPEYVYYMKKAVIHCPVDVLVYNENHELIAELKNGEETNVINSYGRFAVVYNSFTEEFEKVICQNTNTDLQIEMSAVDGGIVNYEFAYLDNSKNLVINKFDTEEVNRKDRIILSTSKLSNSYDIDKNGDGTIDETKNFISMGSEIKSIEKITTEQNDISLKVNETSVIGIEFSPADASYVALEWRSENPDIAIIENGKITALSEGTTKIHVFALDNPNAKLEITVKVLPFDAAKFYIGDVNTDGKINITDVIKVAAHVKGKKMLTEEQRKLADVNSDGKINISDITKIAAHVKGKKMLQNNNDSQNENTNTDPEENGENQNGDNNSNIVNDEEYAEILYDEEYGRWYVIDDKGNKMPLTYNPGSENDVWYAPNRKKLNVIYCDNVKNPNYDLPDKVAYLVLPNGDAMQLFNVGYTNTIYNSIDGHVVSAIGNNFDVPWANDGNYGLIDPNKENSGRKITIPDYVTYCGSSSMRTWGLDELQLSKNMLCIEDSAFMVYDGTLMNDTRFNNLKLNDGLKYIGDKAFLGYSALTSVRIPSSVKHIGDFAFGYCTDIEKLQEDMERHIDDESFDWRSSQKYYKKVDSFIIYGQKGTEAERYAVANGFIFIDDSEVLPNSITLNKTSLILDEGSSELLTAQISPSNATDKSVKWSSSNTSVASVNDGLVMAKSAGTATITAKTANNKTATCSITVRDPQEGYIKVYSANDFNNIRNNLSGKYVLMNDIDLTGFGSWIPIGDPQNRFNGVIDGNNHNVTYKINESATAYPSSSAVSFYYGLIGYAYQNSWNVPTEIKNLNVYGSINTNISSYEVSTQFIGAIAGYAEKINIINCNSNVVINSNSYTNIEGTSVTSYVGGITGWSDGCNIENCINNARVDSKLKASFRGTHFCGGICGVAANATNINYCENYGDIRVSTDTNITKYNQWNCVSANGGGIAGNCGGGIIKIENCCSNCHLEGYIKYPDDTTAWVSLAGIAAYGEIESYTGCSSNCSYNYNEDTYLLPNGSGNYNVKRAVNDIIGPEVFYNSNKGWTA